MHLSGITLETEYFEDYLSFLTEVLELELTELTDISMRLDLEQTWIEIKKVPNAPHQVASNIVFALAPDEFQALVQKIKFFYHRKESSRFLFIHETLQSSDLMDPDGRIWRFNQQNLMQIKDAPLLYL
jgi:catechol-2,3-dioxygenase